MAKRKLYSSLTEDDTQLSISTGKKKLTLYFYKLRLYINLPFATTLDSHIFLLLRLGNETMLPQY